MPINRFSDQLGIFDYWRTWMEIHINTGNGMENDEALEKCADGEIRRSLSRFSEDLRRVEVHLSDVTSVKGGAADKRCLIEVHVPHHVAVAVSHQAPSMDQAFRGAETKALSALESSLGKVERHRDRTSIRVDLEAI